MPMLSNVHLHMSLIKDLEVRAKQHADISVDLATKAKNMLDYAQCHCEHEFLKPPAAYAHEGELCKHCGVNSMVAREKRLKWLAMENAGTAPWGPRAITFRSTSSREHSVDSQNDYKQTAELP